MATLPVLDLGADPHERGVAHGRAMAAAIRANLETYFSRFESGGATVATVRSEGERWAEFIAADNADYGEEMAGIAGGAGLSLTEIAVLNARYEITYCLFSSEARVMNTGRPPPEQEGCTSFGLMPEVTASGHTVIGENWDWLENIRGHTLVQRVSRAGRPEDGKPDFVGFTEAGIAGCKMGVNAAGIGLCVNGLVTARDGANGLRKPFHVRCREVLDAWTFDKALQPVVQTDRTCSTNFLIAHADGEIINIEATPDYCTYLYPVDGLVVHANHLVKETRIASEFERIAPHSLYRGPRLERLLRRHAGRIDLDVITEALSDHFSAPAAICRHPDTSLPAPKRVISVTAIAIDLNERLLYATDGQICQSAFQRFTLPARAAATAAA
jgi:isopenicillin-N N-acyltransferase like protein